MVQPKVHTGKFESNLTAALISERAEATRIRAQQLIESLDGPPYELDCEVVRRASNVKEVRRRKLSFDGRIFWAEDAYVIEINSDRSKRRQRFTLAHEIGHTFFLPISAASRNIALTDEETARFADENEEEYLCDVAASELLMPTSKFVTRMLDYGPSALSILAMANEFETSVSATARRFAELSTWKCHIGFWRVSKAGSAEFDFAFHSCRLPLTVPRGFKASSESVISRAIVALKPKRGWSDLGLVSSWTEPLGPVYSQAVFLPQPRLVLSVTVLERYPQYLVGAFQPTKMCVDGESTRAPSCNSRSYQLGLEYE